MTQQTPVRAMKAKSQDPVAPTPQNTPATHPAPQLSRAQVPPTLDEEEEDEDDIPVISSANSQDPSARVAQLVNLAGGGSILTDVIQSRFNNLIGASSGYVESLPQAVKSRLTGLKGIQAEQFVVESELKKEILELKKKYAAKFDPLFERRKEIVLGLSEATDAEFEKGLEEEAKDEDSDEEDSESEEDEEEEKKVKSRRATKQELEEAPKGVPEFWLTAMKNHVGLGDLISERDELLLKHLTDIKVSYDLAEKGKLGFKLIFEFNKEVVNKDWFGNEGGILEKTYYYQDKVAYDGDFVYDKAVGTKIAWKEGKDLTVKVEKKRQRNKNTGQTRTIKKTVPTPSFFTFFSPPDLENLEAEDDDDDEDDLRTKLELDYQIGVDIQERLIPRAIDYFTGRALEFDETDFDDDDDFALDDDDEDEEDEEEEFGQRKIKKAPKPPISGVTPTEPQECRNQ